MDFKKARLDNLQNQIDRLECDHPKKTITKRGPHFCWQCFRCGSIVGQWIPHDKVLNKDQVPNFDDTLKSKYLATVREYKTEFSEIKREIEKTDFDAWYAEYLKSDEWKQKRALVLARCADICEGCRKKRAIIVHHKTYINVGREFLFELVGLCKECHDSLHDLNAKTESEENSHAF